MDTPQSVESLFVFEAGSINTIIKDNHGTIYTNRSGENGEATREEEDVKPCEEEGAQNSESEMPALAMLRRLIDMQKGKGPKAVLLPYKAAIEAGIPLPMMDYREFNARFGTDVSKSSFSNWVNGTQDRSYTLEELEPYINAFKALI